MKALLVALGLLAAVPAFTGPAFAANAEAPNKNVDKTNDAGNSTGNAQTERLNNGQLDQNQRPAPKPATAPAK